MADENAVLKSKGRPLMRKDNMIYYGSMADSHIVLLQILETETVGGEEDDEEDVEEDKKKMKEKED